MEAEVVWLRAQEDSDTEQRLLCKELKKRNTQRTVMKAGGCWDKVSWRPRCGAP